MKVTNHSELGFYASAASDSLTFQQVQAILDKFHAGKPLVQSWLEVSLVEEEVAFHQDPDFQEILERVVGTEPQLPTVLNKDGYREVFAFLHAFMLEQYGPPGFRVVVEYFLGGSIPEVLIKDDEAKLLWKLVQDECSDGDFEYILELPHFSFE